jgi:prepilin-type N-terminal cleavage/methylation domain-containing protein
MARKIRQSKDMRGFTLVELIVVVVLLAVVAAVVIPQAISSADFQAVSGARLVASDLQYAQNVAITAQSPVTVTFYPASRSYSLTDYRSQPLIHPITKSAYTVNFAAQRGFERLGIVSASFGGAAAVTFDELGSPSNAGTVVLRAGPHTYRIEVAASTGKVTVTVQ